MADNPSEQQKDGTWKCRDGKDKCENCRDTEVSKIKSAHFTLCAKPWCVKIEKKKIFEDLIKLTIFNFL